MHVMYEMYEQHRWFFVVFLFCAALVVANIVHYVLFRLVKRGEASKALGWGLQKHLGGPARAIFLLTCVLMVLPIVPRLAARPEATLRHVLAMAMVTAIGWFCVGLIYVTQEILLRKFDITAADNRRARTVHTQFQLFRRVAIVLVVVMTVAALLWTSNDQRLLHFGSGLLASAGLATLILATAAKSTASNFLAGLQIALTEPIRIDDVVVVSGEWARVEEITSAYVVLKIWDLRRLIVPLTWFIENPFANWTRESSNILTTAFLYLDYMVPVKELRTQLQVVLDATEKWDRSVVALQVTNLTAAAMEIRCLMSAKDASTAFDLQCIVREAMMEWVKETYPEAFPNMRYRVVAEAAKSGELPMAAAVR